jgi:hypothetical protein
MDLLKILKRDLNIIIILENSKINYLGLFLNTFGWSYFSLTLIEQYPEYELKTREDWYLHRFKPLLNYLTFSYRDPSPMLDIYK